MMTQTKAEEETEMWGWDAFMTEIQETQLFIPTNCRDKPIRGHWNDQRHLTKEHPKPS